MIKTKSVKSKILFGYGIILFIIISIFSVSLFLAIKWSLENEVTKRMYVLEEEITHIIDNEIENILNIARNKNDDFIYDDEPDLFSYDKTNDILIVNIEEEPEFKDFYFELRNIKTNKTILKSSNMKKFSFIIDKNNINIKDKRKIPFISKDSKSFFKSELKKKKYILIIASSLKVIQKQLDNLILIIIVSSSLLFLLSFFLGYFLVNRTISPMKSIMQSAKHLNANDLSKRLNVIKSNDEFEELGTTFNSMFEQIESSFIKLKNFNGDASHELKTPLTIIIGEIELLLKKDRTKEEYKDKLNSIYDETKILKNIIDTLLTITTIESSEVKKSFKLLDISNTFLEVHESFFFIAQEKGILLDIKEMDHIQFLGNELLLKSLFSNIIDNAIKFSPKDSKIFISLKKDKKGLIFEVFDNGIGIKEEEKEKLFERFYRTDKSHNKKIKGYGLGLSIVKSIVNLHQGKIELKNNKPKGSIFKILLKE